MRSRQQKEALVRLDEEIDNIRLAWRNAVAAENFDLLCEAACPLYYYFELHQYFKEAEELFRGAAEQMRARLTGGFSSDLAEQARLEGILAGLLNYQGFFNQRQGQNQAALELFETSLAILRPLSDTPERRFPLAFALVHYGVVHWAMGNFDQAAACFGEGLSITRSLHLPWLHSLALGFLGGVNHDRGDYHSAHSLLGEAVAICQKEGDPEMSMLVLLYYSRTLLVLNKLDEAEMLLKEGLQHVQETGNRWMTAVGLDYLGRIARASGDERKARRLLGESIVLHREVNDLWSLSLSLIELSRLMHHLGEDGAAEQHIREVLKITAETGYTSIALEAMSLLAAITVRQGQTSKALLMLAYILQHPASSEGTRAQAEALRAEITTAIDLAQWEKAQNEIQASPFDQFLKKQFA